MIGQESNLDKKDALLEKLQRLYLAIATDNDSQIKKLARNLVRKKLIEELFAVGATSEELQAVREEALYQADAITKSQQGNPSSASAAISLPSYPGTGAKYGYSSQTWLARVVNDFLHPGSYFCWFATNFNAMVNGDDSNPIWLYLITDRAVKQGGIHNAKVRDIRANLMRAVDKELRASGRSGEVAAALAAISAAPLDYLTPQVWRLDLGMISGRYTSGHQYPDEYKIVDLKLGEFEIVVE